jgi:CRP-like cAMP-binding protein
LNVEDVGTHPNDVLMQESTHPAATVGAAAAVGAASGASIPTILEEGSSEEHDFLPDDLPTFKSGNYRNRRVSVSAESMQPTKLTAKSSLHKKIPKSESEISMITDSLQCHFLFKSLEDDQCREVIDCMEKKKFHAGETIIEQGAVGDFFYIVSSGNVDCFVDNHKVTSYQRGGSFGELALMYNAPRAATLRSTTDTALWALDRVSFRSVLMENNANKRRMHEEFLKEVPLFKSLEISEIHKIADALEPVSFIDGDIVLRQGDPGDNFYLIERGEALFYQSDGPTRQVLVNKMKKGDYFGGMRIKKHLFKLEYTNFINVII